MGLRNYLIEGISGAGKTTVAEELERRGYHVIHGDRALAYPGDPETCAAVEGPSEPVTDLVRWRHEHWIWDVNTVKSLIADQGRALTFFCGGARNHRHFLHLFDEVFVLNIDAETLNLRLSRRAEDEFGGRPEERQLIAVLHATKEGLPPATVSIDATMSVTRVVDEILLTCEAAERSGPSGQGEGDGP
jgi:hypothetical protein